MSDTRNRVIAAFATHLRMDPAQLTDATGFDDVKADSLDLIEIVMSLEDVFGVEITDDEWVAVRNVGEAVALVESKVGVVA